jgi:hypothetical protein
VWAREKKDISDGTIGDVAESLLETKEELLLIVDGQNHEIIVIEV